MCGSVVSGFRQRFGQATGYGELCCSPANVDKTVKYLAAEA